MCVCACVRTQARVVHPSLALTSSCIAEVSKKIGPIHFAKLTNRCCAQSGPPTEPSSIEVVPWFLESHLGDLVASGLIGNPPSP